MAEEKIVIRLEDKIDPNIVVKIERIGAYAETANRALQNLKAAMQGIKSSDLGSMLRDLAKGDSVKNLKQIESLNLAIAKTRTENARAALLEARATDALAKAKAREADMASRALRNEAAEIKSLEQMSRAATMAATAIKRLEKAQIDTSRSQLMLDRARSKNIGAGLVGNVGGSIMGGLKAGLGAMAGMAGIYGAGQAVQEVIRLTSAYVDFQNKLRLVTNSEEQLVTMTEAVYRASQRSRTGLEDFGIVVQRVDLAIGRLGYSHEESIRIAETLSKSYQLSGASASEMANSIRQMTQAFNANKLAGDEFRSVSENAPLVMKHIADSMGVPIERLKTLGSQGKITGKVLADALLKASTEIDKAFGKMKPTFAQSKNVLENAFMKFFGDLENEGGILGKISKVMMDIAAWFDTLEAKIVASNINETLSTTVGLFSDLSINFKDFSKSNFGDDFSAVELIFSMLNVTLAATRDLIRIITGGLQAIIGLAAMAVPGLGEWGASSIKSGWGKFSGDGQLYNLINPQEELGPSSWTSETESYAYSKARKLKKEGMNMQKVLSNSFFKNLQANSPDLLRQVMNDVYKPGELRGKSKYSGMTPEQIAEMERAAKRGIRESQAYEKDVTKIAADLNREKTALFMTNEEKTRYVKLDEIRSKLLQNFLEPSAKQLAMVEKQAESFTKLRKEIDDQIKVSTAYARIIDEVRKPAEDWNTEMQALEKLQKDGKISQEEYNKRVFASTEAFHSALDPLREYNMEMNNQIDLIGKYGEEARKLEQYQSAEKLVRSLRIDPTTEEGKAKSKELASIAEEIYQSQRMRGAKEAIQSSSMDQQLKDESLRVSAYKEMGKGSALDKAQFVQESLLSQYAEGTDLFANAAQERYNKLNGLLDLYVKKQIVTEEQANAMRLQLQEEYNKARYKRVYESLDAVSGLMKVKNKELFQIGKVAAIANAVVSGKEAVIKAYGQGGIYGAVTAAAVGITVAQQIADLMSTEFKGYSMGGYTGNGGTGQVAGVVHGQEYVVNAAATRRNRAALERMNAGQPVGNSVNVNIENYGTSKSFEVVHDENSIRIIARDEMAKRVPTMVAAEVQNPNSKVSKSISANVNASRKR